MKLNLKLSFIALILLAIFTIGAVSAGENITDDLGNADQSSDVEIVSTPVNQEAETQSLDVSASDNTEDATNEVASDTHETQKSFKNNVTYSSEILKAGNDEDVLSTTIVFEGDSLDDLKNTVYYAADGDIIDLVGKTIFIDSSLNIYKNITVANGFFISNLNQGGVFNTVTLENLSFSYIQGLTLINSTINNVIFDTVQGYNRWCTFYVENSVFSDVDFTNCHNFNPQQASDNYETGVMIVSYNSNYDSCRFINCSSNTHSGAICVAGREGNTANITNCIFENCTSGVGGAVYLHGTGLTEDLHSNIINCSFTNCEATEWGGALGSSQNYVNVENCDFINNTAKQGAAFMVGGITHGLDGDNSQGHYNTMSNCYFYNNTGSEQGGAVHITGDYNTAVDCIFEDNYAHSGDGAAIYVKGDHATVSSSQFYEHDSVNGTVYIIGDDALVEDSIFMHNTAYHGGAGVFIDGDNTIIDNNIFENNTARIHGGAVHTRGNNITISNNEFYNNTAIPDENPDTGLGGAIYIDGRDNTISNSHFKYNTARNGSAIYNNGRDLHIDDDTFEFNQAWSYFLFTEAKPPEAYWTEDHEEIINITLVAGDNLINAIYNNMSYQEIYFHNVTYTLNPTDLYPTGIKTTRDDEIHPVDGIENSQGGLYLYQDAREDDQLITVNVTYDGSQVFTFSGNTDMSGNVLIYLTKENLTDGEFHPGVYNVTAAHPDDNLYTAIENSTTFTILPQVDVSVTKTSNKDVYYVGENAIFTITVNSIGTNASNVTVEDILPSQLTYVSASATQGSYDPETNVWDIGFMPHGSSQTLTLTVLTTETGDYNNIVNVTCTERDWNLTNNVDNKTIHVNIYNTKEANVTVISAGDYVEYYLRIFNIGDTDYTETLRVRDLMPDGIRYISYELAGADLVRYVNYSVEQYWEITNIPAGLHAKITVKAQALIDGLWNNTMILGNNSVNSTVNVSSSADLQIIKSVSTPTVNVGDVVNWTIYVINHGPSRAYGVYVDDILPDGLEIYGRAIPDAGTTYDRRSNRWTIGEMGLEEIKTLIIPTTVTISAINITNVAVVNSTTPDPDLTNNEDNDTIYFNPDVSIEKFVSSQTTSHGSIISWTIVVTNNGPNTAEDVYVIDQLPSGLLYINSTWTKGSQYNPATGRWAVGSLEENETANLTINTQVTSYDGYISNNATVYASNDNNPNNNYAENFTQVSTEADVSIVKLVSNQTSHYGDEIVWTIVVTNNGPNAAENVYVIDFLPVDDLIQTRQPYVSKGQIAHLGNNGLWTIGTMENGETQYCEVYTKVTSTNKTIINVVNVTTSTYDPELSNNWAENGTYVPPEADVSVEKTVSNSTPNKYDVIVWTISVINLGPDAAEDVIVTDILPDGLEYVSHEDPTQGSYRHNAGVWSVGTLEVNSRQTLTITTRVVDTGNITNEVNVTTSTYDTDLTNNYDNETINVPAIADLQITKLVSNQTSNYGDLINWTITVYNAGPNNARNVVVTDKLPDGLVYITHELTQGLYDSAQGIWQIGDVLHYETQTLVITTLVSVSNATITNVAVVTSSTPDSNETNNEANNTTVVGAIADLAIDKTVNDHSPSKGDNITWIITVTNNGPDTAVNAYVIDIIPDGLTYINSTSQNGSYDENTNTWTIGDLANGETVVLYIVTSVDVTREIITNVANVTSDTTDPDLTNNEDNSTIDIGHEADLSVIKTVSNSTPLLGDTVTWNITVTNNGPDDAIGVYVEDVLPEGLIYVSDDGNGAYNPISGIWTIGTLTNGSQVSLVITTLINATGNITNTAVVDSETDDPYPENNTDDENLTATDMADLEVIKVVDEAYGYILWQVLVINHGPNTAKDVYVVDVLPEGLIYDDYGATKGSYNETTHIWTIGDMNIGDMVMLYIWTYLNKTSGNITNVALVNSSTYDPNPDNNEDNDTYEIKPIADLEVIKEVSDKNPKFGETITWTVTVTNNGPSTAVDAYVDDILPDGLVYVSDDSDGAYNITTGRWTIGNLTNGSSAVLNILTLVNITNATITNVAVVNSSTPDSNETNNKGNNTTAVDPEADLMIVKVVSNSTPKNGETVTWTITVTNNGPDTALNVYVVDEMPEGLIITGYTKTKGLFDSDSLTWFIPSLAKDESQTLTINTLVNASNAVLINNVTVTNDVYDPNETNNNDTDNITVPGVANLVVVKVVSDKNPSYGDTITWTVTVTNNGPDTSVNTVVIDNLPEGLIFVSSDGDYNASTGIWTVGNLTNGESKSLVITTLVNITNATIRNVANVTSDTPGNRTNGTNDTTVSPIADLEVVKLVSNTTAHKGDVITWTIIVTNNGPDTAKAVNVTDKLPDGLIYNGHSADKGLYDPSAGIWIIGDMAKGESQSLVISTVIDIDNATIVNVAVVNSSTDDNNTDNNIANNTTVVDDDADLEIVKTVSNKNPKYGETITWTITVTNKGPSDAKNVIVTDKLPAELIFVSSNGNYNNNTGIWTVGDLAYGESASLVITTIVNMTNTTITNIANVTSDTPDSNETNNEANNTTDVDPEADLVIVKVVSDKNPSYGDTITWTVTVTNNGPDTAKGVTVTDKLPEGLIFVSSNGDYNASTGIWTVGDLANKESRSLIITTLVNITNATIRNVANVTSETYDPNKTNNEANNTTDVDPLADLEIVKLVSNSTAHKDDVITWTIIVTNNGPDTALNVYVVDEMPQGLIITGYSQTKGLFDVNSLTWFITSLDKGESQTLTVSTRVNVTNTTLINAVNVTSDTPDSNETNNYANNTTDIPPEADIGVVKEVNETECVKDQIVEWTITMTNYGPDAAVDVVVKDNLPDTLIFISSDGDYNPETGIWTIDYLASGETKVLTIITKINTTGMVIVNNVTAASGVYDPNMENNNATNSTKVNGPADLAVTKVVSDSTPHKGDTITWTITVVNNGPDTAKNVTVTDKLPEGLIFVSSNGNYDSSTGIWTIGDLANGESTSLVITTVVDITNAEITNVAVVNSTTPDNNTDNNRDNDTSTVEPEADVKVVKTVSNPKPSKGDTVTWTVVVVNLGPDAAENVKVSEKLPDGLKLVSAKGSKGSYSGGIWTVGTLKNGEIATLTLTTKVTVSSGTITNIVVATSSTYDPNKTNNRDKEKTKPKGKSKSADLELIKTVSMKKVKVGDKVVWTLTVINHGPNKAKNVVVYDYLTNVDFLGSKSSKGSYDPLEGIWTIGTLKPGEKAVLKITVKTLYTGTMVNKAKVESDTPDPDESNNKDKASVKITGKSTPNENTGVNNPPVQSKMHPTGNPILLVLLALFAAAGIGLRRKN